MDRGMALVIALDSIKEQIDLVEEDKQIVLSYDHPWRQARRVLSGELDVEQTKEQMPLLIE